MSKKLSQDEISQLLDSIAAGDNESLVPLPDTPLTRMSMKIKPFDFKHPDKFLSNQLSGLSNAFENSIRKFQLFLKEYLGKLKKKNRSLMGLKQEYLWGTFSSHLRKSFILIFQSWQKKLFQFFQIKNAIAIIVLMILQFNTMIWVLLPLFLLRQGKLKATSIYF
jgi:hypothetical protein